MNETMTNPINETNPSGIDLRNEESPSKQYRELKTIHDELKQKERQALQDGESITGRGWEPVIQLATDIISKESKDLEVLAWLIEAQTRLNGFEGFANTISLTKEICEQYWDSLYPQTKDDTENRLLPLIGLNGMSNPGALIGPLYSIPLINNESDAISTFDYLQAKQLAQSDAEANTVGNQITIKKIHATCQLLNADDIEALIARINAAIQAFRTMVQQVDQLAGSSSVFPSSHIDSALNECLKSANELKTMIPEIESADTEDMGIAESKQQHKVMNNEQAIEQLTMIAEYFRASQPHSPVSYLIEKAIHWNDLSLPELLNEMMLDPQSRQLSAHMSGIPLVEQEPANGSSQAFSNKF